MPTTRALRRHATATATFAALALAGTLRAAPPSGPQAAAANWRVDPEASSFVVLTHRAGPAARLAHDHVVVAHDPTIALAFDPRDATRTRVSFVEPVLALEIDAPEDRQTLEPRLRELGLLREPLGAIDPDERAKVRAAMLDAHQLFADRFPEIRAELSAVEPGGGASPTDLAAAGTRSGEGEARLAVEIRGTRSEQRVAVSWSVRGDELDGDLVAELRFTAFGIQPYSSYLGLVRNDDRFDLVAHLVARRTGAGAAP